ncbi:MAG: hypothetical protein IJS82_02245 [Paludibacteraceae bacterium]|nr:hypothetical protein [Paludibacteraceae bacterium]
MKKIMSLVLVAMMGLSAMAQQHEIGAVVGGLNGLSHKYWFNDNVAVQTDLAVGLSAVPMWLQTPAGTASAGTNAIYDFTLNPNLAYHFPLTRRMFLYAGGGVGLGMLSNLQNTNPNNITGKFGVNALCGIEFQAKSAPVAVAFDFRPGYGLGFTGNANAFAHFFDWKVGLAVRYML